MSNIPKIIHYCWFGKKTMTEVAQKCIASWKKYCSGFEFRKWDEGNFDINSNRFVKEAYESKKYAFVTDYVRLFALYHYGGIYMDTDVEVLKSLDAFLNNKGFSGFEEEGNIPTGIMGSIKHHPLSKELLAYYNNRSFIKEDGSYDITTNVKIITNILSNKGFKPNNTKQTVSDFTFYPKDYFCPKSWRTGELEITENTHTIHHFLGSWVD